MIVEESAGGIVYRVHDGCIEILIGQHSGHHGWVFPKGLIGDHIEGEQKEETAVREVREETGITGKIVHPVTPYVIYFQWKGEKHQKTVHYYVMEYVSGDPKDHDWEMSEVIWLPIEEVERKLTYPKEKQAWLEAKKYIEEKVTTVNTEESHS